MRFLFRLAAFAVLVVAVLAGTVDSIQSVSASSVMLTDARTAWTSVSPATFEGARFLTERYLHPAVWDYGAVWLLAQPAFAVLLGLALILWMIGYKRRPAAGRFAA